MSAASVEEGSWKLGSNREQHAGAERGRPLPHPL